MLLFLRALGFLALKLLVLLFIHKLPLLELALVLIGVVVLLARLFTLLIDAHQLTLAQLVQLDLKIFLVILQLQYFICF